MNWLERAENGKRTSRLKSQRTEVLGAGFFITTAYIALDIVVKSGIIAIGKDSHEAVFLERDEFSLTIPWLLFSVSNMAQSIAMRIEFKPYCSRSA